MTEAATYSFLPPIKGIQLTIKRGDQIDSEVAGNKFWKLKYNLLEAQKKGFEGVLTFGGAFSNHLAATAAACSRVGLKSVGYVRGEEWENPALANPTLEFCKRKGMELRYMSRSLYRNKSTAEQLQLIKDAFPMYMILPEGGTNTLAIKGCAEVLTAEDAVYDTICVAVGTGGTLAGLVSGSHEHQQLLGFMSLRNSNMEKTLGAYTDKSNWELQHDFSFGGYGKTPPSLIAFINAFKKNFKIPLEPLYTGKMLFGIFELIKQDKWRWGKNVLIIHTGGLKGIAGINQRLTKKGLPLIQ
jgi:1-aminocyclopropane-1-carboxylate deaminase